MKTMALAPNGKRKQKYFAKVDDEDFEWLSQRKWFALMVGRRNVYAFSKKRNEKTISMHREVLKRHNLLDETMMVDHRDHNGLNNQKSNLRPCTHGQNFQNNRKRIGTASKYKGVGIQNGGRKKWRAQIFVNGKQKVLGTFTRQRDAAKKYDEAAIKYFGEFANTNFK